MNTLGRDRAGKKMESSDVMEDERRGFSRVSRQFSYFQDSPPKVNFTPERKVKGSAGNPKAAS